LSLFRRVTAVASLALILFSASFTPARTLAAGGIEPSDVVLVFDFSASMQEDEKNLDTAISLRTLADRIPKYADDIIANEIIVHLVWFRGEAVPVPGCGRIQLNSANTVSEFADCLGEVASVYEKGPGEWRDQVGQASGTNYEAAFTEAINLLEQGDTSRPAIIFFTDGEHTGIGKNAPSDRSWLNRIINDLDALASKAVLPVGLGVTGEALEVLEELRDETDLPGCPGSASGIIDWSTVSFPNGKKAGDSVADAFAAVTCVKVNEPPPPPTVPDAPQPPSVSGGDGSADISVEEPSDNGSPISGYVYECIPTGGGETVSASNTLPEVQVDGLQNGDEYRCRAAAENEVGPGGWSETSEAFTPCSGLFGCNPWLIPLLLLLLLLLLLAAIALAIWAWRQRTRGYVVASVAGFPQVNLLRGPKTGMSFVSSSSPSDVDGLRRDIQSTSHLAIENLGGGRFKWTDRAGGGSGIAEPGQSFTVTDPTGTQREVKLRAFGGRPKNIQTTVALAGAAGASTTATWGSGSSSDGWGGGGSGWDGGGSSSSGGGWG
jgi:hypothetical protein